MSIGDRKSFTMQNNCHNAACIPSWHHSPGWPFWFLARGETLGEDSPRCTPRWHVPEKGTHQQNLGE
jgi:hypothetical protein